MLLKHHSKPVCTKAVVSKASEAVSGLPEINESTSSFKTVDLGLRHLVGEAKAVQEAIDDVFGEMPLPEDG